MLHSRVPSPKNTTHNNPSLLSRNMGTRSKSITTLMQNLPSSKSQLNQRMSDKKQLKTFIRAASAFKKPAVEYQSTGLPKVFSTKGKLHLGKISKPQIILKSELRNNPWAGPNPINEGLINKKGLMDIINMGIIPKNVNFTELLNNKYEEKKIQKDIESEKQIGQVKDNDFFATNPGVEENNRFSQKKEQFPFQNPRESVVNIQFSQIPPQQSSSEPKIRKKVKKSTSKKQNPLFFIRPQTPILQINNQKIEKNEKYNEQLQKSRINGNQVAFKLCISHIQKFAVKYNLKKFQFKLAVDETRKISDSAIREQIINARALGIHFAMKGGPLNRAYDAANLFAARYKFKRAQKDLLKIQNIKRYFKVKKFYEQMTKKRTDYLKFKLGSFAERQRRFVQQSLERSEIAQKFRVQIHITSISDSNYEDQLSYYKIQCRNNIQLTRLFNTQPQYLVLLSEQKEFDISCWLNLIMKVKGYHPTIVPLFSNFPNDYYKTKIYDSIYYGMDTNIIKKMRKICGKKEDIGVFPNAFNISLVHICELLQAKLYSGSFCQTYLDRLLVDEEDQSSNNLQKLEEKYGININRNSLQSEKTQHGLEFSNEYIKSRTLANQNTPLPSLNILQPVIIPKINISVPNTARSYPFTPSQLRHLHQKRRIKQLNSYELTSQHYSNKLVIKRDILKEHKLSTPQSIIFEAHSEEKELYEKFTQLILENRLVNKWVFKIGINSRFSRGLAFLETNSLKILKEKKKMLVVTRQDFMEVANIMKVILLDKLEIPHNSLLDSVEFLQKFLKFGGYIEAVIEQVATQCVFGQIQSNGQCNILGTYTKIYTNEYINCGAIYPSSYISQQLIEKCVQLSSILYKNHNIFGHITLQLLISKEKPNTYYFIDLVFSLQQYSSLYFMYNSIFNAHEQSNQQQAINILSKYSQNSSKGNNFMIIPKKSKLHTIRRGSLISRPSEMSNKDSQKDREESVKLNSSQGEQQFDKYNKVLKLKRKIIYIPFIDNNGNIYESFEEFETACSLKSLKSLDFQIIQGIQFLYLNLRQQKPDVLSLVIFSKSQRKALKYLLQGLNFVVESGGQNIHKFDKKVERRKYDCLYIHDIVWKFREMKKAKDNQVQMKMGIEI